MSSNNWHEFNDKNVNKKLIKGKDYLVKTFDDKYKIATFNGNDFFGLPAFVKAWSEFERYYK